MTAFLIIYGEVEVRPGIFEPSIVASSSHANADAAEAEWERLTDLGLYEEPWETYEVRPEPMTLGELVGGRS